MGSRSDLALLPTASLPTAIAKRSMKARIRITLKNGVLDPQGKAIQNALAALGIGGVDDVRQGKYIEVQLSETDEARAKETVERMCKDLLANSVIENYSYELAA
ncbi:phosphoribosylformylglycinamidine synthase subunit PurS [Hyphomicrobium sp. 1Nfss2.1]